MSKDIFLNTKPSRLFVRAAVPGAISMIASSLYIIFESVFVGKFVGTTAFAALGMALPVMIMNFALGELVGVGSSVPIAIFLGEGKEDKANNYFTSAILLTVLTGIFSGAVIYIFSPTFMSLMGADGELLEYGVKYLRTYAVFSPITPLMFSLDNYLRISGKTKTSMLLNIMFSVVTVLLEIVFILSLNWGVVGAAFASSIAMILCVLFAFIMFIPGKLQLKFTKPRISWDMIWQILKNGITPFLTNISGRLFSIIMNIFLLRFGGEGAVAVYTVVLTVACIFEQPMYGVVDSLQPAVGYNYGAARYDRVISLEKHVFGTALAISLLGVVLMLAIPGTLAIPFLEDVSLLPLAIFATKIAAVAFVFKWLAMCIQCFFMALEKPRRALMISVASAFAFPMLLIPIFLPLELTGLWWNYPISTLLTAALAVVILLLSRRTLFKNDQTKENTQD